MIGYLIGKPLVQAQDLLLIVQGVGYRVKVGLEVLTKASQLSELELFIHTHVKEDTLDLYGFATLQERNMFELLLSVSGVGPRTALAIAELGSAQIVEAVQQADVEVFSHVPRVGKKVAQKIIIELKPKLGDLHDLHLGPTSPVQSDVQEALTSLGFSDREIRQVSTDLDFTQSDTATLVKQAIKLLTKKSNV